MGLNDTPSGERVHIGIFGCVNAGKSSLINALTSQRLAIVSPVRGTTTDPVSKSMELLPLGPVTLTDTPGLDDETMLAPQRRESTLRVLEASDLALLVVDSSVGMRDEDRELLELVKSRRIPYLIIYNKCDSEDKEGRNSRENPLEREIYSAPGDVMRDVYLAPERVARSVYRAGEKLVREAEGDRVVCVSALTGSGIEELKDRVGRLSMTEKREEPIISDLVKYGDLVILIIPVDDSAPTGRLILPQPQTIRELLEAGCMALSVRDTELSNLLADLESAGKVPALVVTDSQAFESVSRLVPPSVRLTSFSILMAKHKGSLDRAMAGAAVLDRLCDGDLVIISEGCTHHRQCGDIGTVKLPAWIREYTKKELQFEFTSGGEFADDELLKKARLCIHCGGCMLTEQMMKARHERAALCGCAITNYGIAIAKMKGILDRAAFFRG